MRKIILAMISLLTILLVGCSDIPIKVPDLQIFDGDSEILVTKGGYHWTTRGLFNNQSVIADAASPDQIAETIPGDNVKANSELTLKFSEKPKDVKVVSWGESKDTPYTFNNDKITVPNEEGTYIYEIIGEWPQGHVSYTIKIIIL